MVSLCTKMRVMFWKCLLLRSKNWLLSACELLVPLLVLFIFRIHKDDKLDVATRERKVQFEIENFAISTPKSIFSFPVLVKNIAYTPKDNFTSEIMTKFTIAVNGVFLDQRNSSLTNISVEAVNSQPELNTWLRNQSSIVGRNELPPIGIVFFETNTTVKKFIYSIRTSYDVMRTDVVGHQGSHYLGLCLQTSFLSTQIHLDAELLRSVGINYQEGERLIGELPMINNEKRTGMAVLCYSFALSNIFLVISVLKNVLQEKASGVKELMRTMGVSSWMMWTNWVMYSLCVHLPLTVFASIILTDFNPPTVEANTLFIWFLLFLYTMNCIFILLSASCLFNGTTSGVVASVFTWIIIHTLTAQFVINSHLYDFNTELLVCLIPLNNLFMALRTIMSFSTYGLDWKFRLSFEEGFVGNDISVLMAIIIFTVETLFLVILLAYLDAVWPGPYGVSKSLTFVFDWCIRVWNDVTQPRSEVPPYVRSSLPHAFELPPAGAKVGIEIRGLTKIYGVAKKNVAVNNVNLDIYEGEIMALLGHNGAGKTTTMSMITGMFPPTHGVILIDGNDVHSSNKSNSFIRSVGLCPQRDIYFPKFTVTENILICGMLKGMSYSEAKLSSLELITSMRIASKKNNSVSKLSHGTLRRVCLAMSLIGQPKVLILDEPTSGLDIESRRDIWNIILGLRGQRTILITTHFMEEADALGDRIAIMDHGQVVCCGTTMFLKTLYGTGYHLHVLKEGSSATEDISYVVQQNVPIFRINVISRHQVEFIIGEDFVDRFPRLFESLEKYRNALGIKDISITCTTIGDVFVKVAEKSVGGEDELEEQPQIVNSGLTGFTKSEGTELFCQRFEALIWKRILYRRRNWSSLLFRLIFSAITILLGIMKLDYRLNQLKEHSLQNPLKINLSVYPNSFNLMVCDTKNKNISDFAVNFIEEQGGKVLLLPEKTDIMRYAINQGKTNKFHYVQYTLLAVTLIKESFKVLYRYSDRFHLPSIAVNLMSNTILQNSTNDRASSIEVINHPYMPDLDMCAVNEELFLFILPQFLMVHFSIALIVLTTEPFSFMIEERVSGFKHQQMISGVSSSLYWFTSFINDFFVYALGVSICSTIILLFGKYIASWNPKWASLIFLILILHGVSGIVVVYIFTSLTNSLTMSITTYCIYCLVFGTIPAMIMYAQSFMEMSYKTFILITTVLSLNPTFAVTMSIGSIVRAIVYEELCEMCGGHYCLFTVEPLFKIPNDEDKTGILIYVCSFLVKWVLYLIAISIIECSYARRLFTCVFCKKAIPNGLSDEDEDVQAEAEQVQMFKEKKDTIKPLRVVNMGKKFFAGPVALNKISFAVSSGECFGLLGVHGAGKTTMFKILTGELLPDSGNAFVNDYSVLYNKRKYLSRVGYCPQKDALMSSFTAADILTILIQIQGTPREEIQNKVNGWLKSAGIWEHARTRCDTYSGGTKRKLSTAMAFIGNPSVVFLDEPTTGVDPLSRRKLWTLVHSRQREGQAVVLTSHSMDECESLCSRITIIEKGRLKCIGSTEYLKKRFGQGFVVFIKLKQINDEKLIDIKKQFVNIFQNVEITDENMNQIQIKILDGNIPLSTLFSKMLQLKNSHEIIGGFSVSNTTLEQLFLSMATKEHN